MVKFREASPGAAYEIAEGIFDAEEAAKLGLAVVENDAFGRPARYGRYKGAPDGGPLGITVDKAADSEVIAGGGVSAGADQGPIGNKGNVINPDDPFVHGTAGEGGVHADGAIPMEEDVAAQQREAIEASDEAMKKAAKQRGK